MNILIFYYIYFLLFKICHCQKPNLNKPLKISGPSTLPFRTWSNWSYDWIALMYDIIRKIHLTYTIKWSELHVIKVVGSKIKWKSRYPKSGHDVSLGTFLCVYFTVIHARVLPHHQHPFPSVTGTASLAPSYPVTDQLIAPSRPLIGHP